MSKNDFSLFVHLLLFWSLERAVLRDCDISWVSSHIFHMKPAKMDPVAPVIWKCKFEKMTIDLGQIKWLLKPTLSLWLQLYKDFIFYFFFNVNFTICLWLGPPWFNYWFSFTLAYSRISHEYSSLFIIVINLIFVFSLWCIDWVGSLYANRIFMCFCI